MKPSPVGHAQIVQYPVSENTMHVEVEKDFCLVASPSNSVPPVHHIYTGSMSFLYMTLWCLCGSLTFFFIL